MELIKVEIRQYDARCIYPFVSFDPNKSPTRIPEDLDCEGVLQTLQILGSFTGRHESVWFHCPTNVTQQVEYGLEQIVKRAYLVGQEKCDRDWQVNYIGDQVRDACRRIAIALHNPKGFLSGYPERLVGIRP